MDPLTILAALLPVGVEAGKYLVQKYLAPDQVKPGTFAEFLQLRAQDLEFFRAMQGGDGDSYPWVAAVRQLQRPAFGLAVLSAWCWQAAHGGVSPAVGNMAAAFGFYLFGDRSLFYSTARMPGAGAGK